MQKGLPILDIFKNLEKIDYIFFGFLVIFFINSLQEWYFTQYIFPFYMYFTLFLIYFYFKSYGFYFYLVSFFFTPLLWSKELFTINITTIYIISGIFVLFAFIHKNKKEHRQKNINDYLMVSWFIFIILNIFFHSIEVNKNFVVMGLFEGIIIYFLISYFITNKARLKKSVWFIMFAVSFYGIRLLRDYILGGSILQKGLYGWDNNYLAMLVLSGIALSYFLMISVSNKKYKLFLGFAFFSCLIAVVMGASRGAFLGLFVVGIYILFKSISFKTFKYLMFLPVLYLIMVPLVPEDVRERYVTLENITTVFQSKGEGATEGSMHERIQLFWAGVDMFKDNPMFGVGLTNYPKEITNYLYVYEGKASHSMYIQFLAEIGIFGSLIFFLILFFSFHNIYSAASIFRKKNEKEFYYLSLAILGGMIGYCSAAFFLNPQHFGMIWMFCGLAAATKFIALKTNKTNSSK